VATASVAYPEDLTRKVQKAISIKGFKFMHLISPCPPDWKMPSELSIDMVRKAVAAKVFPMYEIEDGEKYRITVMPDEFIPVREYLKAQGRFRHLSGADINRVQESVDAEWEKLLRKVEFTKQFFGDGDGARQPTKKKKAPAKRSKKKTVK
jgi:pyruvate ferredoxin oxidoreductase beta subunit/2-oxoisovalerate ferredoxin oxidoreductase beta subunit